MPKRPAVRPAAPAPLHAQIPSLDGAPWYVKAVWMLLTMFGFPVFIVVVMLMMFIGYIPSPLTSLQNDMRLHMDQMKKVLDYVDTSTRVNRQVCRNTSTDNADRRECDR